MTPGLWLTFALVIVFCVGTAAFVILTAPRDKDDDR